MLRDLFYNLFWQRTADWGVGVYVRRSDAWLRVAIALLAGIFAGLSLR